MITATRGLGEETGSPSFTISPPRLASWLEIATVVYLALPCLIWLIGWLRPEWACAFSLLLLFGLALFWRQQPQENGGNYSEPAGMKCQIGSIAAASVVIVVWSLYSGAGGLTTTNSDWLKHFAILRDLIEQPWPVRYRLENQEAPLVYYLGYYLVPAIIGKVFGWSAGCVLVWIWSCCGALLAVAWFALLVGRAPFLTSLFFIAANGLDWIGDSLLQGRLNLNWTGHLDWWALALNLPGHTSQLYWAPQHSLAAWSLTGLIVMRIIHRGDLKNLGLILALGSFWSPFTMSGVAPFVLLIAVSAKGRGTVTIANGIGLALLLLNISYLGSLSRTPIHGFFWIFFPWAAFGPLFALAYALEWVIFVLFAEELRRARDPIWRWVFWTAIATLILYPYYRVGVYNDWGMRATIPSLFLIWVGVARSIAETRSGLSRGILVTLCLIGAIGPVHEFLRPFGPLRAPLPINTHAHVYEFSTKRSIVAQYLGSSDSLFFRHLAAPSAALPGTFPPEIN